MGAFDGAEFMEFNNGAQPYISAENLLLLQKTMMLCAHPVGSYYWSSDNTDPSELFGGTWTQIKDKFVYALGDSGSVGDEGGASSKTLVENNIPKINGTFTMHSGADATNISTVSGNFSAGITNPNKYRGGGEANTGASSIGRVDLNFGKTNPDAIDILPPYIKAYCWRRTA